jgi:hypothetical protein
MPSARDTRPGRIAVRNRHKQQLSDIGYHRGLASSWTQVPMGPSFLKEPLGLAVMNRGHS